MLRLLAPFAAPSLPAVQFAIKTLVGGGLALWLAFRFDLQQPQWAFMTAFIVAQPLSGMVVLKGLARVVGTLIGTVMAVLMIALFAQTPWLFLTSLALWMALCTAASTMLRSAWNYSFVLAGYTVAIIGLPLVNAPLTVFDQAVARFTEITLGIACATLVSAVLWPQRVERLMVGQARQVWDAGLAAVLQSIQGQELDRKGLLDVLGKLVAVDAQREHAWFEGPVGRNRASALRTLSRDLLGALRLARGVSRQCRLLDEAQTQRLSGPVDQVVNTLRAPVHMAELEALTQSLREQAEAPHWQDLERSALARLAVLCSRLVHARLSLRAVEQGLELAERPSALSWHRDWQTALFYGSRSGLAFLLLAALWMGTAWTHAATAMIMAGVACSLFASRDNAAVIGWMFMRGVLYAAPVALLIAHVLLPQVSGFAMLCLVLGPALFFGTLGMANPLVGVTAIAFTLNVITFVAPHNTMHYDVGFFFNEVIAVAVGVGCALLAFNLLQLRSPTWHIQRLLRATLQDLKTLTWRPVAGAENWFGGRMADRLLRLARHYLALPAGSRARWDDGVVGLDFADELLHLRSCLAVSAVSSAAPAQAFMQQIGRALERGPKPGREAALDDAAAALVSVLEGPSISLDKRLAITAVEHIRQTWRRWCQVKGGEHGLA